MKEALMTALSSSAFSQQAKNFMAGVTNNMRGREDAERKDNKNECGRERRKKHRRSCACGAAGNDISIRAGVWSDSGT